MNDCPFRYQGQYQDEETGLYYNRFRYYDPNVGNYISKDPIGLAGGNPTLYGYVRDSNGWVDPWGWNGLDILEAEYNGGHSLERHGSHLPSTEMESRTLGTHPTMPQSRSALKFDTDNIHQDAINKAYATHKSEIDAHFASGGGYKEWDFDYGSQVGSGYTNTGTRKNPIIVPVTSNEVRIAMAPDGQGGYRLDSAYPNHH